jgi:hypothetical protein
MLGLSIASAGTIDFSTALPTGHLGESVSIDGVTVSAWDVSKTNGNDWSDNHVILNNRRDGEDDNGLGVCSKSWDCPTSGNGDINEIDNNGSTFEVIRLDFGSPTDVTSIGLSSLDSGLKDSFAIFGSDTPFVNLSALTPLAEGSNLSEGSVNPVIAINQLFQYFFVTTESRSLCSSDSDFLLKSVTTGTPASAPEPLSEALTGSGLIALALIGRLRRSRHGVK